MFILPIKRLFPVPPGLLSDSYSVSNTHDCSPYKSKFGKLSILTRETLESRVGTRVYISELDPRILRILTFESVRFYLCFRHSEAWPVFEFADGSLQEMPLSLPFGSSNLEIFKLKRCI